MCRPQPGVRDRRGPLLAFRLALLFFLLLLLLLLLFFLLAGVRARSLPLNVLSLLLLLLVLLRLLLAPRKFLVILL